MYEKEFANIYLTYMKEFVNNINNAVIIEEFKLISSSRVNLLDLNNVVLYCIAFNCSFCFC